MESYIPSSITDAIRYIQDHLAIESTNVNLDYLRNFFVNQYNEEIRLCMEHCLSDGGPFFRSFGALVVGLSNAQESIPLLIDALQTNTSLYVRCDIIMALGRLKAEESIQLLYDMFSISEYDVKHRIILSLKKMKSDTANIYLEKIKNLLSHNDSFLLSLLES